MTTAAAVPEPVFIDTNVLIFAAIPRGGKQVYDANTVATMMTDQRAGLCGTCRADDRHRRRTRAPDGLLLAPSPGGEGWGEG